MLWTEFFWDMFYDIFNFSWKKNIAFFWRTLIYILYIYWTLKSTFEIIHFVKKIPGTDHSKTLVKEIGKNLFDAELAPLPSILTWSSSAICDLVCSQCSILSVYLKFISRFFQYIRISNKEFVSNFILQMEFRVQNRWKCYRSLTVNRLYQKHVHMSGTVHSKTGEMFFLFKWIFGCFNQIFLLFQLNLFKY